MGRVPRPCAGWGSWGVDRFLRGSVLKAAEADCWSQLGRGPGLEPIRWMPERRRSPRAVADRGVQSDTSDHVSQALSYTARNR